jgi:hypothetical protein
MLNCSNLVGGGEDPLRNYGISQSGSPAVEIISHGNRSSMTTFQKIVIKQLTCDLTLRLQELVEVQKTQKRHIHPFFLRLASHLGPPLRNLCLNLNSLVWFLVISKNNLERMRFLCQRCSFYFKTGEKFGHPFWNSPQKLGRYFSYQARHQADFSKPVFLENIHIPCSTLALICVWTPPRCAPAGQSGEKEIEGSFVLSAIRTH